MFNLQILLLILSQICILVVAISVVLVDALVKVVEGPAVQVGSVLFLVAHIVVKVIDIITIISDILLNRLLLHFGLIFWLSELLIAKRVHC